MLHPITRTPTIILTLLVVLAGIALGIVACGDSGSPAPTAASTSVPTKPAPTAASTSVPTKPAPAASPTPAGASVDVTYTYDGAGRLTQAEYSTGVIIKYTYDKAGNLLSREVTKK